MATIVERSASTCSTPAGNRPQAPTFASMEEERLYRKQRLAAAFRLFGKFGFDEGVAGHITARDPELLDHVESRRASARHAPRPPKPPVFTETRVSRLWGRR